MKKEKLSINFPNKLTLQYRELDDFVLPIVLNVCYLRNKNDSTEFFEAHCPNCGAILNTEGIAYSASLRSTGGGATGCPHCGFPTLVATLKGLTDDDKKRLQRDKFFRGILRAQEIQSSQSSRNTNNNEDYCFIATACYGSMRYLEVQILRDFRDKKLLTNRIGTRMVKLYYDYSPPIASFLSKHIFLSKIVRINILNPIALLLLRHFKYNNKNGPKNTQERSNLL